MKNRLTEEQLRLLRANVNVEKATEYYVVFTEQFKQLAWEQKQAGKRMREIFRENGIDPELLGDKRIENFNQMRLFWHSRGAEMAWAPVIMRQ